MQPMQARPAVPARALAISLGALAIPALAEFALPATESSYELLLWLLPLLPAFMLAYYMGWRGAATALAGGMAVLSITIAAAYVTGETIDNWPLLLGIVGALIAISLGIGYSMESVHVQRERAVSLAYTDELTGLPNRRLLNLSLEREFDAARRGRPLAVVLFDLDHFKEFNDTRGHLAGDEALRAFAGVLKDNTRAMNVSARMGGEEFLSVLSSGDAAGACRFAESVRASLGKLYGTDLTVSAGVAAYVPSMASVEQLIEAADRALYLAKKDGRDGVAVAPEAIGTSERAPSHGSERSHARESAPDLERSETR